MNDAWVLWSPARTSDRWVRALRKRVSWEPIEMLELYSGRKGNETINWKSKPDEELEKVCDRFGGRHASIGCC